ncbi:hypothetical protein ACTFIU_011282 [Dictyostelium citrinum]
MDASTESIKNNIELIENPSVNLEALIFVQRLNIQDLEKSSRLFDDGYSIKSLVDKIETISTKLIITSNYFILNDKIITLFKRIIEERNRKTKRNYSLSEKKSIVVIYQQPLIISNHINLYWYHSQKKSTPTFPPRLLTIIISSQSFKIINQKLVYC